MGRPKKFNSTGHMAFRSVYFLKRKNIDLEIPERWEEAEIARPCLKRLKKASLLGFLDIRH